MAKDELSAEQPASKTVKEFGKEGNSDKAQKDKAVRQVVPVMIEQNGGDGGSVKPQLDSGYPRGLVWLKDARVAEWTNGHLRLMGAAGAYQEAFDHLMHAQ